MKPCSIQSCPGEYEERYIAHVVKHHGEVIVIDNVPAEVCSACGDVLLSLDTAEAIESLLTHPGKPDRTAPVYELHGGAAA
jgi:HTH-type transcriptional regulator / antitoxin MqsA